MGLFKTHTVTTRANKISSFSVATAEYGAVVPDILGTTRISGNVIYYDDFTAHEHKETHKSGKGGGVKSVNITYTYSVAAIIALCEGEISGVSRVWNDKDIYNAPSDLGLTLYTGTDSQTAWPYTIQHHKDKALPYKGLAYVAGVIDLGDSASFPSYNFEIKGKLLSTGDGTDVNPADYIKYILDKVGLGSVEIEGYDDYKKYCAQSDLLISTPMDDVGNAKAAQEIINEIATITNAYIFWSNDHYKIVVMDDESVGTWTPNTTIMYDLTPADFIPMDDGACVTYQRKDRAEIYNQFPVQFTNRANGYESETVNFELTDDISNYGLRQASSTSAGYIYTKERAVKVAKNIARRNQIEKDQYTFQLDWTFCRLEPGDLVRITDEKAGIVSKVVAVTSVTEDETGLYTVTAVSRKEGTYSAPTYTVHDTDRPYIETNTTPDKTTPVMFQPPVDLTDNGLELWIGAKGAGGNWGGCVVYASDDKTNYREVGQIASSARFGTLVDAMTATGTTAHITCNDSLIAGTAQDAQRGNTLCWIDGECMSYEGAEMQMDGSWKLSGLVRGQYNTTKAAHATKSTFVRCDNTLLKQAFSKDDIGKTIYLKFCSVNMFGYAMQDLSDVDPYEYVLTSYYLPPVTDLKAYNRYRELADGVARYDIVVEWNKPNLESYLEGQVWYKQSNGQARGLTIENGKKASELGFSSDWTYAGSGETKVVIPQAVVGDTYHICVVTKDIYGATTSHDLAPTVDILVALKTTVPDTPQGAGITFGKSATLTWQEVTNADIAYYEVRTDKNPGLETSGLQGRTSGLSMTLNLSERTGTVYVYARSAQGKYSYPAVLEYNKPVPSTPNPPVVVAKLGGMAITADAIPSDCVGMRVYIDGSTKSESLTSQNNMVSYLCDAGIYDVSIAYYDLFGEGSKSATTRCTVKVEIDGDMIKDESISLAKVDKSINSALEEGKTANASVNVVVDNLNSADGYTKYTALTQLSDAINLRVKDGDVINQINLSKESILIDGKKVHITGDTVFDNNIITKGMIQAGAVSADKLAATSISALGLTIGNLGGTTGQRTTYSDKCICVYDSNGTLRVRLGLWDS